MCIPCWWLLVCTGTILCYSCSNISNVIIFWQVELTLLLTNKPTVVVLLFRCTDIFELTIVVDVACWSNIILLLLLRLMWSFQIQILIDFILLVQFKFAINFSNVCQILLQTWVFIKVFVWSISDSRIASCWRLEILLHSLSLLIWCLGKRHCLLFILIQLQINLIIVKVPSLNWWLIYKVVHNNVWHSIWSLNWHVLLNHWVHVLNVHVVVWLEELLGINFTFAAFWTSMKLA